MGEELSGKSEYYWIDSAPETNYPQLEDGLEVDVAILGGGVVGINTALHLKNSGKKVALIEANHIIKDVSAATTAKVSAHKFYTTHLPDLGEEKTQLYAESNREAVESVQNLILEYNIDCDFRRVHCYLYSESEGDEDFFKAESKLAVKLGFDAVYATHIPTASKPAWGVLYKNQAQFHPRKYLLGLVERINGEGVHIFEKTRALDIKGEGPYEVITDQGSLKADNVVIATHFPIYDPDKLYQHLKVTRTYILAYYSREDFPDAVSVCINPFHTYRSTPTEKGDLIILAGEHQSGGGKNTTEHYKNLEKYAKENWDVESIEYHWLNQDNAFPDGIPAIGETSQPGIYVATGFNGWGMTQGTTAGMLISDLILKQENPLKEVFDPLRFKDKNQDEEWAIETMKLIQKFKNDEFPWPDEIGIPELAPGEAKVLQNKFSIYKDDHGKIHRLQAVCTHMGCTLVWNDAERTWDCPCHASRFNHKGQVIHGPAINPLKNYSI